jgi:hypothetical protein
MPSPHPLKEVFQRTSYRVRLPRGGSAVIRVDEPLPEELWPLLPAGDASWGFITACNPLGQTRPHAINRRAMRALRDVLHERMPDAILCAGFGALGGWREPSLFVAGVEFDRLERLMQRFDQLAILRGKGHGRALLHWAPWLEHADPYRR